MPAEMLADLIVSGGQDFEPFDVQRQYKLVADEIWHIGDPIGRSARTRDSNAWILSTGRMRGHYLSECLALLMKKLDACWAGIFALCSRNGIETQLSIAVYVYDDMPALNCNREVVHRVAQLHADIDIDVIMLNVEN